MSQAHRDTRSAIGLVDARQVLNSIEWPYFLKPKGRPMSQPSKTCLAGNDIFTVAHFLSKSESDAAIKAVQLTVGLTFTPLWPSNSSTISI